MSKLVSSLTSGALFPQSVNFGLYDVFQSVKVVGLLSGKNGFERGLNVFNVHYPSFQRKRIISHRAFSFFVLCKVYRVNSLLKLLSQALRLMRGAAQGRVSGARGVGFRSNLIIATMGFTPGISLTQTFVSFRSAEPHIQGAIR